MPVTGRTASDPLSSSPDPVAPEEFDALMSSAGPFADRSPLAVAVSGGADSMALLWLLKDWATAAGKPLTALTVDHGLRPESAAEARQVGRWCAGMGVPHDILSWTGDKPAHRVQEEARRARYALMEAWCARHGVGDLFVAHTENDQAETFLFRMSRGSGSDGLAAMPLVSFRDRVRIIRPLLTVGRPRLEATLRAAGQPWVDDPGNNDRRYARVRVRHRLADLDGHGISVATVACTARIFGRLRAARETQVAALAAKIVTLYPEGYADIDRPALAAADPDIASSLMTALIAQTGGREFAPKRARSAGLFRTLVDGPDRVTRTLGSCVISATGSRVRLWREFGTISEEIPVSGEGQVIWDGRFIVSLKPVAGAADMNVSALGRAGWEAIAGDIGREFRHIPGPVRYGLPAIRRKADILQVWHLDYRAPQMVENIIENAVFRGRPPISGPPFWVA
ncbi:MAG: tRNA lysidine(34) synthetase TilS [Alphaproteobacteria bacterium]